jgi:hypothetical protein
MDELMRRLTILVLASTVSVSSIAAAATQVPTVGSITGTAQSATGQTVANIVIQLRDLATGRVAGTTTSSSSGAFEFIDLVAGIYSVEIVNAVGQIVGASAAISVAAGGAVTGVTVTASAATAGAAAAPSGSARAATVVTAVVVTTAAAAAGIAAVVAAAPAASPSQ